MKGLLTTITFPAVTLELLFLVALTSATALEPTSLPNSVSTQTQEEADAYKNWYDANSARDFFRAMELAKAYLQKFPNGNAKNVDYLKKQWIPSMRGYFYKQAADAKNVAEVIRIGKEVLAEDPDNLDYIWAVLLQIRKNELSFSPGNFAHASDATDLAQRAIRLFEAGKTLTGVKPEDFKRAVTLAYLHQTLALIYDHNKDTDKALAAYVKAAELDPANVTYFFHSGRIYNDRFKVSAQKYDAAQKKVDAIPEADRNAAEPKPEAKAALDEAKAALAEVKNRADAVITYWARYLGLTADEPSEARTTVLGVVTGLYKFRHNGSTDGLGTLLGFDYTRPSQSDTDGLSDKSDRVLTPRQIAQKVMASVVSLEMHYSGDDAVILGSGFFVRENVIATNYHVVKGASWGTARVTGGKGVYLARVLATNPERDLALLQVTGAKGQPLTLGGSSQVAVGDAVYVVGNPEGLQGTFSPGIVSGIRPSVHLLQITAPISHGSSGGPVLNENGQVIGIAVSFLREGQNLNFAVPVSYLISLCATIR